MRLNVRPPVFTPTWKGSLSFLPLSTISIPSKRPDLEPNSFRANCNAAHCCCWAERDKAAKRSEEHTSELQSLRHLVCRLLLEKKKYSNLDIGSSDQSKTGRKVVYSHFAC